MNLKEKTKLLNTNTKIIVLLDDNIGFEKFNFELKPLVWSISMNVLIFEVIYLIQNVNQTCWY